MSGALGQDWARWGACSWPLPPQFGMKLNMLVINNLRPTRKMVGPEGCRGGPPPQLIFMMDNLRPNFGGLGPDTKCPLGFMHSRFELISVWHTLRLTFQPRGVAVHHMGGGPCESFSGIKVAPHIGRVPQ